MRAVGTLALAAAMVAHCDALHVSQHVSHGLALRATRQGRDIARMGLFDGLAKAFANEEFDDRSAKAQHILLKGGDMDTRAAAAEAIRGQIMGGELTFEKAAREFSECSSKSAVPAGSLGRFEPGKMVPEFDAYCFSESSKVGEIGIVETQFGTHLIKLNEQTLSFDPRNGEKTDGGWSF